MTKVPQLPFLEQIQEQSISYNELKGSKHKKNLGQFLQILILLSLWLL